MGSAGLANHFGGAVNANHVGARGCDLRGEMTRAAADVQDALARLRVEQFQKPGSHLPDKGVLFIVKPSIPPCALYQVQSPPISSTAPVAVSSVSPPCFPKCTLERAKLALATGNVPEQSVFKYGRW